VSIFVAPSLQRGMLFEEGGADWLRIVRELDRVSLHASHRYLSEPLVAQIRAAGMRVLANTVNDSARGEPLAQWGADMM